MPPCTLPSAKFFVPEASTLLCLMSELLGGPKFTSGDPTPPGRPLTEKFFVPKASTSHYLIVFLISTF